jgi:hypothetical protein
MAGLVGAASLACMSAARVKVVYFWIAHISNTSAGIAITLWNLASYSKRLSNWPQI